MLSRRQLGDRGEELAARYLAQQGYRVLARNHRTSFGELDLVAEDGAEIVFVEVKTRFGTLETMPQESVNPRKVDRLTRLAEAFLAARGRENAMWRIDVV